MKKALILLLMTTVIGGLVGCGTDNASSSQEQTVQKVQQKQEQNEATKVEEKKSLEERKQEAIERKKQAIMEKYEITLEDDGFYYNNEVEKLIPVEEEMKDQIKRLVDDQDYFDSIMFFGVTEEWFDTLKVLVDGEYVDMTDSQGQKLLLISDYDHYNMASEIGIPKELADKLDSKTYDEWFDAKLNGL